MKKLILLYIYFVFMISGCGQQNVAEVENQQPPKLIVSCNDQQVVAVLGTYSWSYDNGDGTSTTIEADSDIPPKLVQNQEHPLYCNVHSKVKFDFALSPIEITVNIWNENEIEREVGVESVDFQTDEIGTIVYEIVAKWGQGSAHYAVESIVQ